MFTKRNQLKSRLKDLGSASLEVDEQGEKLYKALEVLDKKLEPELCKAGFIDLLSQTRLLKFKRLAYLIIGISSFFIGTLLYEFSTAIIIAFGAIYFFALCYSVWLKLRISDTTRAVYFELPLFIEEIILLVESGLGLFPSLEQACNTDIGSKSVVRKTFREAYQLAASGIPVSKAFEHVAKATVFNPIKHVFLHLEVSSSVGGELLASLRSLSEQIGNEWKISVETRVKRLENLVVFPVFLSVIGLMLLTAAVPLVPVLDFMSTLKTDSVGNKVLGDEIR